MRLVRLGRVSSPVLLLLCAGSPCLPPSVSKRPGKERGRKGETLENTSPRPLASEAVRVYLLFRVSLCSVWLGFESGGAGGSRTEEKDQGNQRQGDTKTGDIGKDTRPTYIWGGLNYQGEAPQTRPLLKRFVFEFTKPAEPMKTKAGAFQNQ